MAEHVGIVDYSRQNSLDEKLRIDNMAQIGSQPTIHIIGCGGVGFWLGLFAAMIGFQKFVLFDDDKVESSNLNRLPVKQEWNGKFKVSALKATIKMLRPDACVATYRRRFDETIDVEQARQNMSPIIFDCSDNSRFQERLYKKCVSLRVKYVKIGYEGENIGLYRKMESLWRLPGDEHNGGYRTTQANAISSALAGGLGLFYYATGNMADKNINLLNIVGG